jgi:peptidoglycan/LPS O-acetylase OafA/YrhL
MMANRFSHIDALRGIAALLVIWLHVSEIFVHLSPETEAHGTAFYNVARAVDFGRIGVVIFFAISGFVICRSLNGNIIEGSKKFLIRRFWRLYPAFWVSIMLGLFSIWWLFDKPFNMEIIAANITMLPELLGESAIIGLYWTLETELIFYVLCWFLFLNRKINNPMALFLISALLAFLFDAACHLYMPTGLRSSLRILPYNLAIMFWGGLFRYWYDDKKAYIILTKRKVQLQWLLFVLTIIVFVPALDFLRGGYVNRIAASISFGNSYILGLSVFITGNLVFKIKNRFMVWTGTVSYSLYLVHPVIFYSLFWFLKNKAPYWLMTFHLSVYIGFTMVFSMVLSSIIYYLIEKPAIDYAHKLTR